MFVVFDGLDGAGKSTQLGLLQNWLIELGHDVVVAQDPGSTQLGNELRQLLLGNHQVPIDMRAEMLLFTAARAQLVAEVVRPAIAKQQIVLLDRYIFSTVVYQGHAGNLDPDDVWKVNLIATGGLLPGLTFIFDLPQDIAVERLGETLDRMESRGPEYFSKVKQGFLKESDRWPTGVEVIDANLTIDEIQEHIRDLFDKYFSDSSSDGRNES